MNEIGQRIEAARKRLGLTQGELAEKCGWLRGQGRVSNYENGTREPKSKDVRQLATALGVSFHWLATGAGSADDHYGTAQRQMNQLVLDQGPTSYRSIIESRKLPVFTLEMAADLTKARQSANAATEWRMVGVDQHTAKEISMEAFALVVQGNSMEPDFRDGEILIVDPAAAPKPGSFVIASVEPSKEVLFRKYRERSIDAEGNRTIELAPLNQDFPTLTAVLGQQARIIGTVVEHRRKL